jgi:hypothetical protein
MFMTQEEYDKGQFLEAYILFASGQNGRQIVEALQERHLNGAASLTMIEQWSQEFKTVPEEISAQDGEFEWHKCEEYGIPWESSSTILDWLEAYMYPPSARTAKWIWRISQTANWESEPDKLLELADMYTNHERELAFKKPPTFSYKELDLETKTQSNYLRALNNIKND